MKTDDITVRLKVIDEATPHLRAISRQFWMASHATAILVVLLALVATIGFLLGWTLR